MNQRNDIDLVKLAENQQVEAMADQLTNPSEAKQVYLPWPEQFSASFNAAHTLKILNLAMSDAADDDVASRLASRLARLEEVIHPTQQAALQRASGGKLLTELRAALLESFDRDVNMQLAVEKFKVPTGRKPTEEQITQVEQEHIATALKPFRDPKLREEIMAVRRSLDQAHTGEIPDQLILESALPQA